MRRDWRRRNRPGQWQQWFAAGVACQQRHGAGPVHGVCRRRSPGIECVDGPGEAARNVRQAYFRVAGHVARASGARLADPIQTSRGDVPPFRR